MQAATIVVSRRNAHGRDSFSSGSNSRGSLRAHLCCSSCVPPGTDSSIVEALGKFGGIRDASENETKCAAQFRSEILLNQLIECEGDCTSKPALRSPVQGSCQGAAFVRVVRTTRTCFLPRSDPRRGTPRYEVSIYEISNLKQEFEHLGTVSMIGVSLTSRRLDVSRELWKSLYRIADISSGIPKTVRVLSLLIGNILNAAVSL